MATKSYMLGYGFTAFRYALPGGLEVSLDGLDTYETDDRDVQAALDLQAPALVPAGPRETAEEAAAAVLDSKESD